MKKLTKRGIGKFLLGLSLASLLVPTLALVGSKALQTYAAAPRFNFMGEVNGDKEQLTLSKTGTSSSWTDPVSAAPGEEVFMAVYIHNGGSASATNTTVTAYLPSGFNNTLVSRAGIKSDQTAEIFNTTQTGSSAIWGKPDGTINVTGGTSAKLDFVPGSTQWWVRDPNQAGWPLVQMPLPNGQNGDTLITSGVNLGTVDACWQFIQFVTFKVKLTAGTPGGQAQKWVALTGTGVEDWKKDLTTAPGNFLDMLVFYNNTGSATATGVKVTDTLNNKLSYVSDGTAIWRWKDAQGNEHTDPVQPGEVQVNGQTVTFSYPRDVVNQNWGAFFLRFRVKIADTTQFPADSTTNLTNVAQVTSTNGVNINTDQIIIHVVNPPTPTIVFQVDKTADNASQGGSSDPWLDYTTAGPGDTMAFKIDVINEGTADAQNVNVKDTLPTEMTYVNGSSKLYTVSNPSGAPLPDGIVGSGVSISSIPATAQISIKFLATIQTNMPSGTTRLVNTGIVPAGSWNNISWVQASDTATVDVSSTRSLLIDKRVWTGSAWSNTDTRFEEGDAVTYQIIVSNNGNDLATNIHLWDVLPPYMEYIPNSTTIDGVSNPDVGTGTITQDGLILTNLSPGIQKIITFQVRVLDCPPLGDQRLVNTANVTALNIARISDAVAILVRVEGPIFPGL